MEGPASRPGITVIGPATLDLNGFSVICAISSERPTGIVVVGKRATVRTGSVQHCSRGVHVLGEGSHRIERVTAALSGNGFGRRGEGFVVESDGNGLTANTAIQNDAGGFRLIEADRNKLVENNSFFNETGFEVLIGVKNVLEGNRANDNEIYGFHLDSGPFFPV
ncbi:MAG: hypothetical protein FJ144_02720 [Deltaproteobacteria bacterium]|nr:hypothetical protein [Deltaproteobacteria bacterium]